MATLAMLTSGLLSLSVVSLGVSVQEIPFDELVSRGTFFEDNDTNGYESILFDFLKDQIILGAKNALLRLDAGLKLVEKHDIAVPSDKMDKCKSSSHAEEDCQNFIPVLHVFDVGPKESLVYACGTYAFDPMCFARDAENLANPQKMKDFSGENKAPQNPKYKGACASWLNNKPDKNLLFVGASLDAEARTSSIVVSEMSDKPTFKPKKVEGSLKLDNAEFAGSFKIDEFVYFVFRETALEKPTNEISSRIGRVCADGDAGDPESLSFTKARLECGDFGSVQGIVFLKTEFKLFATFSKQTQGDAKSAICQYHYGDIESAFAGDFWCQKEATSPWEVCPARPLGGKIVKTCYGERNADDLVDRVLMNVTVLPACGGPMFETTQGNVLFGALAADRSTAGFYGFKVYVGDNRSGKVWSINLGYCNQSEVNQIWEVTRETHRKISLGIVSVKTEFYSVYVLTCCGLFRYPGVDFIPTTERTAEPTIPSSIPTPAHGPLPSVIIRTQSTSRRRVNSDNVKHVNQPLMFIMIATALNFQRRN